MILIPIYVIFGIIILLLIWAENKEDTLWLSYMKTNRGLTFAGNAFHWMFFFIPLFIAYTLYYFVYYFFKLTIRNSK